MLLLFFIIMKNNYKYYKYFSINIIFGIVISMY